MNKTQLTVNDDLAASAKALNAKAASRTADRSALDVFNRQERVSERIAEAQKFIASFPKWWQTEIAPTVSMVESIRFPDGTPAEVQRLTHILCKPVHGGAMGGSPVMPIVDQLADIIRYAEHLKVPDIQHLNGYSIARSELNRGFRVSDGLQSSLLQARGQLRRLLKDMAESTAERPIRIEARI